MTRVTYKVQFLNDWMLWQYFLSIFIVYFVQRIVPKFETQLCYFLFRNLERASNARKREDKNGEK